MKQSPAPHDIGKVHLPPIDYINIFKLSGLLCSVQTLCCSLLLQRKEPFHEPNIQRATVAAGSPLFCTRPVLYKHYTSQFVTCT
jgi:hypothetical protein